MSTSDWIQTAILSVLAVTFLAMLRQTIIQNRLFKAQLLKDRFEMYWKTYEPVLEGQIDDLKRNPSDYMDLEDYIMTYKNSNDAIKNFIMMSLTYEYLAFTHTLINGLKIPDPIGDHLLPMWTKSFSKVKEFQDVHKSYREYYPDFECFVDMFIYEYEHSAKPGK